LLEQYRCSFHVVRKSSRRARDQNDAGGRPTYTYTNKTISESDVNIYTHTNGVYDVNQLALINAFVSVIFGSSVAVNTITTRAVGVIFYFPDKQRKTVSPNAVEWTRNRITSIVRFRNELKRGRFVWNDSDTMTQLPRVR